MNANESYKGGTSKERWGSVAAQYLAGLDVHCCTNSISRFRCGAITVNHMAGSPSQDNVRCADGRHTGSASAGETLVVERGSFDVVNPANNVVRFSSRGQQRRVANITFTPMAYEQCDAAGVVLTPTSSPNLPLDRVSLSSRTVNVRRIGSFRLRIEN
jgi:hypothetical protein